MFEAKERTSVKQLRAETRMMVMLSGSLVGRLGTSECRIHDISRTGACIGAAKPHAVGEAVTLVRGALEVKGQVAWSRAGKLGITFDHPIRATDLLVQMSQSRQAGARPAAANLVPLCP